MLKMRTIGQAAKFVKTVDPESALTERAIRRMVINGTIPSVTIGRKRLVALENIESYMSGINSLEHNTLSDGKGVIREIRTRNQNMRG